MDNKLKKLFDYQKFENNSSLNEVIKDSEARIENDFTVDDDLLDLVAGGKQLAIDRHKAIKS